MVLPIMHTTCGGATELRTILDDDGSDVIVCWCLQCDRPIAEMSREPTVEDIPLKLVLETIHAPKRVQ